MRHQVSRFVPFGLTIRPTFWLLAIALLTLVPPLRAQSSGTIQGSVSAEAGGAPLAGVTVNIPALRVGTLTDARGRFQLVGVPAGTHEVVAERLGLEAYREVVEIGSGGAVTLNIRLAEAALLIPTVVVSATRETQRLSETTSSVGVISSRDLQDVKPTHPSEIMSQVPGVWINVTGGEGHQTAIRQPKSTNPVYLFLEDGVPTRSTGFFNHNALYEVNLPQADRVEVLKGPASA
jgi:outer membrane receptor protein involved in Fe transport